MVKRSTLLLLLLLVLLAGCVNIPADQPYWVADDGTLVVYVLDRFYTLPGQPGGCYLPIPPEGGEFGTLVWVWFSCGD